MDKFMLSCCLRQIWALTSERHSRNQDSSEQAIFLLYFYEPVQIFILFVLLLDNNVWCPVCFFVAVVHLLQGLLCCAFRDGSSAYLGYNERLLELLSLLVDFNQTDWSSLVVLLWPLALLKYFRPETCCCLDISSFSDHYLWTLEMIVQDSSSRSAVSDIPMPATDDHAIFKVS